MGNLRDAVSLVTLTILDVLLDGILIAVMQETVKSKWDSDGGKQIQQLARMLPTMEIRKE